MDLTVNLAPSYRDLKDPTTRQNFDDTVEQKRVIDLRACHIHNTKDAKLPAFNRWRLGGPKGPNKTQNAKKCPKNSHFDL